MIKIIALKKIKDEEFEVTFSIHRKEHRKTLFYHQDLWVDSLQELMPYLNPANLDFQPFLRNNPTFTKKVFELIETAIDGKTNNFPIMIPLEWEADSQHLKVA